YHLKRKREVGKMYSEGLSGIKGFQLPLTSTVYSENIYWVFGLVAESQELCESMVAKLTEKKIGTRPFFWPMHEQPVFRKRNLFLNESYPVAEKMARNGFYLPSGLGLSDEDVRTVIQEVKSIVNA
ncbi:MAG: DegT/DnrJ/EryC1/StrS family aminotransferase, partial [Cytophagaceae bacterium]